MVGGLLKFDWFAHSRTPGPPEDRPGRAQERVGLGIGADRDPEELFDFGSAEPPDEDFPITKLAQPVLRGNGMVSRYGQMQNFATGMSRGTRVTMGSTIGYVGSTGWATGPHLHFEIRVDGVARDPRLALQSKGGEPIPYGERSLFQKMRNQTLASLSQAHIANTAE